MLINALILTSVPQAAYANPQGGTVVGGSAHISGQGTSQVTVNQSTKRAVIDWKSFSVGQGEKTTFVQPDKNSLAFNRVTGADPSKILGSISANGQVVLANPNGVVFGSGARVDAAGLVATTHDATNTEIMSGGKITLKRKAGSAAGQIVNEGTISVKDAGMAALLAPSVVNNGIIQADLGTAGLGGGDGFTVDFYGDRMVNFKVDKEVAENIRDMNGNSVSALAANNGTLKAAGGTVLMTAKAARGVVNQAVNMKGAVIASSATSKGGKIILSGSGGATVVEKGAVISATGKTTGGDIKVLGDEVHLKGATVDASGETGGGKIRIGGGYQGGEGLDRASVTGVDKDTVIKADATVKGKGGDIVVWSDQYTDYQGKISARGGTSGGDGGSAEVSGKKYLNYLGTADLRAPKGKAGNLLLDPYNITIQSTAATPAVTCVSGVCTAPGDTSILTVSSLLAALASGNVTVSTAGAGAQAGDITVASSFSWATKNRLTLDATRHITINSGVTIANTYSGAFGAAEIPVVLVLRADAQSANNGGSVTNNGTIDFSASNGAVSIFYDRATYGGTYTAGTQIGKTGWAAPSNYSVSSQFTGYRLINAIADVQYLSATTTSEAHALGQSINGASDPVLTGSKNYSEIFDGQYCAFKTGTGCAMTGFTKTLGFFSQLTATGIIRNMTIGVDSTGNATVAGTLAGVIANVVTTGSINATATQGNFGGVAGVLTGLMYNVSSTGNINIINNNTTATSSTNVGGLVGNMSASGRIVNSTSNRTINYYNDGSNSYTNTVNIGGLTGGVNVTAGTDVVTNSTSAGIINVGGAAYNTAVRLGGIIGSMGVNGGNVLTAASSVTLNNHVTGSANNHIIGGIAGYVGMGNLSNVHATGDIIYTGSDSASIGGLVGQGAGNFNLVSGYRDGGDLKYTFTGSGSVAPPIYLGGLVGYLQGGGLITSAAQADTYNTRDVQFIYKGTTSGIVDLRMGGAIGSVQVASSAIANIKSTGNVRATYEGGYTGNNVTSMIGGLIGQSRSGVSGSLATGDVVNNLNCASCSTVATSSSTGGLIGYMNGSSSAVTFVTNSAATGKVTVNALDGASSYVGGIAGYLVTATLSNNSATGEINVAMNGANNTKDYYIGGLSGYIDTTGVGNDNIITGSDIIVTNATTGISTARAFIGGQVGYSTGKLFGTSSYATNSSSRNVTYLHKSTSTGEGFVAIGGMAGLVQTTVTGSHQNLMSSGIVRAEYFDNSYAASPMTVYAGGLIGHYGRLTIQSNVHAQSNLYATGVVSSNLQGGSAVQIGGLIGRVYAVPQLTTARATGNVTYTGTGTSAGAADIGGLIGATAYPSASFSDVYATGNVDVTYTGAHATPAFNVGGVAGKTEVNTFTDVRSYGGYVKFINKMTGTGAMTANVGGMFGDSGSKLVGTTNDVNYSNRVVSYIHESNASGAHLLNMGGIAGKLSTSGVQSFYRASSAGSVTAGYASGYSGAVSEYLGGMVGYATGNSQLSQLSSSTTVTSSLGGASTTHYLGGLIGTSAFGSGGLINDVYATGRVAYTGNATATVAGGIGAHTAPTAAVRRVFATGFLSNSGGSVSGAVGSNSSANYSDIYYDSNTTGASTSAIGTGVSTSSLQSALKANFADTVWGLLPGVSYPFLLSQFASGTPQVVSGIAYSNHGTTALAGGAAVKGYINGSAMLNGFDDTVYTGANGYYYFLVAPLTISGAGSQVVTYLTGSTKGNAFYHNATGSVSGLGIYGNTLRIISGGSSVASMLTGYATALGAHAADFSALSTGGTMAANKDLYLDLSGNSVAIDAATVSSGTGQTIIKTQHTVTQSAAVTAVKFLLLGTGGNYTLTNSANAIGTIAANTGAVNFNNGAHALVVGAVDGVNGITTTGATTLVAGDRITLDQAITAGGGGTSITLAGTGFTNNAGASALVAGSGGRYLVWSGDPANDNRGALTYAFKQYNAAYGSSAVLGSGSGFLYTVAPVYTVGLTGSVSKVYDRATTATLTGANYTTSSSAIDGDSVTFTLPTAGSYDTKDAGSGKNVSVSGIAVAGATNGAVTVYGYQVNSTASAGIGTITQKILTIAGSFTGAGKTYDRTTAASASSDTTALSGVVSGDTVTFDKVFTFGSANAGLQAINMLGSSINGADVGNYSLSFSGAPTASATIAQKALTITGGFTGAGRTYDRTTAAVITGDTTALSGVISGDTVVLDKVFAFASANAGSQTINMAGSSISGADVGNYSLSFTGAPTASSMIAQKALTITGVFATNGKTYDRTDSAVIGSNTLALDGVISGDTVTLNNVAAFDSVNAGLQTVNLNGSSIGGADFANYTLSFTGAPTSSAVIAQKTLTIDGSFTANGKTYDRTTVATVTGDTTGLNGVISGDTVALDKVFAFGAANAGTQTVNMNGSSISGADVGNYTLSFAGAPTASAVIAQKALTISGAFIVDGKVYDRTTGAVISSDTLDLNGVISGDTVTLNKVAAFDSANAGTRTASLNGSSLGGADLANYSLSFSAAPTASATIAQKTLTIAGGFTANGKTYNGTTEAIVASDTTALSGVISGDTVTLNKIFAFGSANAGTQAVDMNGSSISGGASGNYVLSFSGAPTASAVIAQKALTIGGSFMVNNKTYDGNDAATIIYNALVLNGVVPSDASSIALNATAHFASSAAGDNQLVTLDGSSLNGSAAGNYSLSFAGAPTAFANITSGTPTPPVQPIPVEAPPVQQVIHTQAPQLVSAMPTPVSAVAPDKIYSSSTSSGSLGGTTEYTYTEEGYSENISPAAGPGAQASSSNGGEINCSEASQKNRGDKVVTQLGCHF